MEDRRARRAVAGISLTAVLGATLVTLAVGALTKQPCASGDWADGRQYRRLCYSDIVPLYGTEHLGGGRLPYLDPCPQADAQCDEYPVLTMYFMRTAAWVSNAMGSCSPSPTTGCYERFFYVNAFLLGLLALATSWALYALVGRRALYFAAAPTLLIYGFVNWDLLAVALTAVATLLFLRNRDEAGGGFLGLGAAAKFYPALLTVPFALDRLRTGRRGGAVSVATWSGVVLAGLNLPFALLAFHQWATFFRFNSHRGADWDSLWFIACRRLDAGCSLSPGALNLLSVAAFAVVVAAVWWARRRRAPRFPAWTLGFPMLVTFLLVNKVYSPQYGLWLLPWFALGLPNVWWWGAFEAADVAVFVTRFSWFGRLGGLGGLPIGAFQVALLIRAAVLVGCLVAWVMRREDEQLALPAPRRSPAMARTDP